jgi:hypothetical protein
VKDLLGCVSRESTAMLHVQPPRFSITQHLTQIDQTSYASAVVSLVLQIGTLIVVSLTITFALVFPTITFALVSLTILFAPAFFIIQLPFMFVHNMFKYWRIWSHTSLWAQWDRREACLTCESMHPMSSCGVFERRRQNAETIHATFIDLLSSGVIGDTPGASFQEMDNVQRAPFCGRDHQEAKTIRTRHVATGPWRLQTSLQ